MVTTIRPTADVSAGTWRTPAGQASIAAAVDETSPDGIAPTAYVRGPNDPPGIIGAGLSTAPNAVGVARRYTTVLGALTTVWAVSVGATHDHYDHGLLYVPDAMLAAPTTPVPLVVHLHGATATEYQLETGSDGTLLAGFIAKGWPVLALRQGVTVNDDGTDGNDGKYGNALVRAGFRGLHTWVQRWRWTVSTLLVFGYSAGGNGALNLLLESQIAPALTTPIAGAYLMNPLTSLRWGFASAGAGIRSDIKASYAIPNGAVAGDASWIAAVDVPQGGHDAHIVNLSQFPSIPIRFKASPNDTTVAIESNATPLNDRLTAGAWPHQHQVDLHTGNHGDGTVPAEVTAFFAACLAGGI